MRYEEFYAWSNRASQLRIEELQSFDLRLFELVDSVRLALTSVYKAFTELFRNGLLDEAIDILAGMLPLVRIEDMFAQRMVHYEAVPICDVKILRTCIAYLNDRPRSHEYTAQLQAVNDLLHRAEMRL